MKLYATVTSERNSRPAKKGGDKHLSIEIRQRNKVVYNIVIDDADDILAPRITLQDNAGNTFFSN